MDQRIRLIVGVGLMALLVGVWFFALYRDGTNLIVACTVLLCIILMFTIGPLLYPDERQQTTGVDAAEVKRRILAVLPRVVVLLILGLVLGYFLFW